MGDANEPASPYAGLLEEEASMNLGPVELLIILGIVLLLFGARRLPDLAKSLGKSTREFKKGMQEGDEPAEGGTPATSQPADQPTKKPES
jgi:sec-independent protein translocase protein TatA